MRGIEVFEEAKCIGRWWLFDSTEMVDHKEAAPLCATCPALAACRELLREELTMSATMKAAGGGPRGTWAGKLIGKKPAAKCGTDSGYFLHRRTSEDPCPDCREAHSMAESARYQRRKVREAS